jgi:hypothetical protein
MLILCNPLRCRLSLLTNSALVYKAHGVGGCTGVIMEIITPVFPTGCCIRTYYKVPSASLINLMEIEAVPDLLEPYKSTLESESGLYEMGPF